MSITGHFNSPSISNNGSIVDSSHTTEIQFSQTSNEGVQFVHSDSFEIICSKCNTIDNIHNAMFSRDRENLKSFLESSTEGKILLWHYEKHNRLHDDMMGLLVRLIINRELDIIFKREKVSLHNPLRKLDWPFPGKNEEIYNKISQDLFIFPRVKVPSIVLRKVAKEVAELFNCDSEIYYLPGQCEKKKKITPSGKFVSRIDYMRKKLIESGIIVFPSKNLSINPNEDEVSNDETAEEKLTFLRGTVEPWDDVKKAWIATYGARQILLQAGNQNSFDPFEKYLCLHENLGPELINHDFGLRFPNLTESCKESWKSLRPGFEQFLLTKNLYGEDADKYYRDLEQASEEQKDVPILLLMPNAITATNLKPGVQRTTVLSNKRRKVETEDEKSSKRKIRETFIIHFETRAAADEYFAEKKQHAINVQGQAGTPSSPVVIVVGPVASPEAFFCSVGFVKYETAFIIEAVELAYKIFFVFHYSYPVESKSLWLLMQRLVMKISLRGEKMTTHLNKVMSFVKANS